MSDSAESSFDWLGHEPAEALHGEAFAQYRERVEAELARLDGMTMLAKRRATVLGLAEQSVRPDISRRDVFRRRDTIGFRSYYNSQKDWGAGTSPGARLFQDVLANVIRLTKEYYAGQAMRRLAARQQEWQEQMYQLAKKGTGKLEGMLAFPLEEEVVEKYADGREKVVRKPAHWTFNTVATMLREVDRTGRLALNMDTDRKEITVVGMTLEEWRALAQERWQQAEETMRMFEDEDESDAAD